MASEDQKYTWLGKTKLTIGKRNFLPGQTQTIEAKYVDRVEKSAVFLAKSLVKGEVDLRTTVLNIPEIRNLPDDLIKALAQINIESAPEVLGKWVEQEKNGPNRPQVLDALSARAQAVLAERR